MPKEPENSLFRKKSMEFINSPEKLDRYLQVTSPGVWIVLISIIVLLIGTSVWGIVGRIKVYSPVAVVTVDGKSTCWVPEKALNAVISNKIARIDGKEITLTPNVLEPIVVSEGTNVYILLAGEFKTGDIVYEIEVKDKLEDGIVKGDVMVETISPMSLLFN